MLRKGVHPVAPEVPSRPSGMVHSYVNLVEREEAGEEIEEEDDNDNDEDEEEEADEVLDLTMYSRPKKFDRCFRNIGPTLHF